MIGSLLSLAGIALVVLGILLGWAGRGKENEELVEQRAELLLNRWVNDMQQRNPELTRTPHVVSGVATRLDR